MFTGLVEETGKLLSRRTRGPGARLTIGCTMQSLALGESVAVEGVCLTVLALTSSGFEVDASAETLARTTLGDLAPSSPVHLERATALGGRLGGHLVSGHVDAKGTISAKEAMGDAVRVVFSFPKTLAAFIAEKGSIAVSGVSLTVNSVSAATFDVALVPHTRAVTHLDRLPVSAAVNLEVDLLARYVVRALTVFRERAGCSDDEASLLSKLSASGYL